MQVKRHICSVVQSHMLLQSVRIIGIPMNYGDKGKDGEGGKTESKTKSIYEVGPLSIPSSFCQYIHLFISLSLSLSPFLSLHISVCLSVCLSVSFLISFSYPPLGFLNLATYLCPGSTPVLGGAWRPGGAHARVAAAQSSRETGQISQHPTLGPARCSAPFV